MKELQKDVCLVLIRHSTTELRRWKRKLLRGDNMKGTAHHPERRVFLGQGFGRIELQGMAPCKALGSYLLPIFLVDLQVSLA